MVQDDGEDGDCRHGRHSMMIDRRRHDAGVVVRGKDTQWTVTDGQHTERVSSTVLGSQRCRQR